jgi:tetratricopeptide (TPR) repeat protein
MPSSATNPARLLLLALLLLTPPAAAQPADPPDATTAFNSATALWSTGQTTAIDLLLRRALALRLEALGPTHLLIAETRDRIARNEYNRNRHAEAQAQWREAIAIAVPQTGELTRDVAYYHSSIGAALREAHHFAEAWPYVCHAYAIRRAILQPNDPALAASLDNMGRLALAQGRTPEARALVEESHRLYRAAIGPDPAIVRYQAQFLADLRARAPVAPAFGSLTLCPGTPVS